MRSTSVSGVPRLACAAALLALTACSEPLAPPEPLAPTYVLTAVNGATDPIVIGEHTYPSGTHQLYTLEYDSIQINSETQAQRIFKLTVYTKSHDGVFVPPLSTRVEHSASITRRRDRVIFEYDQSAATIKADTLTLRNGNLVKQGPFGVSCQACNPIRRVDYVYEPR